MKVESYLYMLRFSNFFKGMMIHGNLYPILTVQKLLKLMKKQKKSKPTKKRKSKIESKEKVHSIRPMSLKNQQRKNRKKFVIT